MFKFLKKCSDEAALKEIERLKKKNELLNQLCDNYFNIQKSNAKIAESRVEAEKENVELHCQIDALKQELNRANNETAKLQETLDSNMDSIKNNIEESCKSSLKWKLEDAADKCEVEIMKVMKMDLEQLKEYVRFYVSPVLKNGPEVEDLNDEEYDALVKQACEEGTVSWTVYHNICSLGGCDFNGEVFPNEIEAYRAAAILTAIHDHPSSSTACSSCYAEYMQDCI